MNNGEQCLQSLTKKEKLKEVIIVEMAQERLHQLSNFGWPIV